MIVIIPINILFSYYLLLFKLYDYNNNTIIINAIINNNTLLGSLI